MTTQMIPFNESGALPAHLSQNKTGNEFGFSASFPVLSIKGKVFTINRNGEKTLVTKPDADGEPAASIEVVIINSGPKGAKYARTFYANGYIEGSTDKPDCYSNDGDAPPADAKDRQADKCGLCPQNAIGSGATQQNPKAKACKSSKMLALAPAGQLNDPMMLRVPGGSLVKLGEYGDFLAKRGVHAHDVVTRVGFDYGVAHPALTFKPVGFVTAEMKAVIEKVKGAPQVLSMIGDKVAAAAAPALENPLEVVADPMASLNTVVATPAAVTPAAEVKPAVRATKAMKVKPVELAGADLNAALDSLNFDDPAE